ncbi:hypothetical protein B1M_22407 [Burkholderia sp. TJI49]|nr:hypothetical protein B1M_22407 [Burkholderia sp. TJI49]
MNLFRGSEPEGGKAVQSPGRRFCAHRTKHNRLNDDAGALYRAAS